MLISFIERPLLLVFIFILSAFSGGCNNKQDSSIKKSDKTKNMEYNKLTKEEERVIINKGTEAPFSGKYEDFWEKGTFSCKRCGAALYKSDDKFDAQCGWPSFDDEIKGSVKRVLDADGMRTEIICAKCGAHLGHVFTGEGFTLKNTRHCVNSISLNFTPASQMIKTETAYLAGGCFWGTQYYLEKKKGVISTEVGYIGGTKDNPSYEEVCSGTTGHAEAVKVVFNPDLISYEEVAKLFFEIHDPTQLNRQGPDIGKQYRSEIFFTNDEQEKTTNKLIAILKNKGFNVVTKVTKASEFWPAEEYHQEYYNKNGHQPYCHKYIKKF